MKMLLSTTALVVALGIPALTLAQTAEPAQTETTTGADAGQPDAMIVGFLVERDPSDLHASDLMGHEVHARRTMAETDATGNTDAADGMMTMSSAELEEMDNIGQITEIVLSGDGEVRALVIGVGGFLGMGEHDVAVTMDQVSFAADADDPSQMYIIVDTGEEMLKGAPAYDLTAARTDAAVGSEGTRIEQRTAFAAPEMERDGYTRVAAQDISADMLLGKTVYDLDDNGVGDVQDLILDDDGKITDVIIDFGGFLGIGSSQASLQFDELTILSNDDASDVRIYVDATKEQIQDLPLYVALN